jgi:hypothetical protein
MVVVNKKHLLYRDTLTIFKCMNDKLHSIYVIILNNMGIPFSVKYCSNTEARGTKIWNGLDIERKSISDLN